MFERIVNRFLFHPVLHTRDWVEPPPGLPVEDVELTGADGRRLHAWWTTPDGWHPSQGALLYCHGPMVGYDHHHTPGPDFYATLRDFLASQKQAGPQPLFG